MHTFFWGCPVFIKINILNDHIVFYHRMGQNRYDQSSISLEHRVKVFSNFAIVKNICLGLSLFRFRFLKRRLLSSSYTDFQAQNLLPKLFMEWFYQDTLLPAVCEDDYLTTPWSMLTAIIKRNKSQPLNNLISISE